MEHPFAQASGISAIEYVDGLPAGGIDHQGLAAFWAIRQSQESGRPSPPSGGPSNHPGPGFIAKPL